MQLTKVLVLNRTYEPLHFCNARRAIVLLLKGKAENVELDGQIVHSVSQSFRLPLVIRLMNYIKISKGRGIVFSKKNVFRRDNYTCQYCGIKSGVLTIDHIIPRSRAGESKWENVVVACQRCNLKKANKTLQEVGLSLIRKPKQPQFIMHQVMFNSMPKTHLEVWNKYFSEKLN